jgi:hypothetical protein
VANVTQYTAQFYGSVEGRSGTRARISLYEAQTLLGWIDFVDDGKPVPQDKHDTAQNLIFMHLPGAMFENVLNVLRNEKPISYSFSGPGAILRTSEEPIGESEPSRVIQ